MPTPSALARSIERYGSGVAALLVLAALAVRLPGASEYWLNPDEGIYYSSLTQASFGLFWADVVANAHPPAYYLLLRGMGALTWDFAWLRGLSAVFGAAAVWTFWLVGRELGGRGAAGTVAGWLAAAGLAFNGESIVLSQIMRPYMLLMTLLGAALYYLLRSRVEPSRRNITGFVVFSCLALLTHYSAMLALIVFTAVVAVDGMGGATDRAGWRRRAWGHATPSVLAAALYLWHVAALLDSELMGNALQGGGWLTAWLIETPRDAWNSLRAFQVYHLPDGFQARTALLLLASIGVAAWSRHRVVAVLSGSALLVAVACSYAGVYPMSPSRHGVWLVVFTMPALAWLVAHVLRGGRRSWWTAAAGLVVLGAAGSRGEALLGGTAAASSSGPSNATEEKVILWDDMAGLVVQRMDRESGPRIILSTEQTYHLLSPLYPSDRESPVFSADSSLFRFSYGSREIVVRRGWDWEGADDMLTVLGSLPARLPGLRAAGEDQVLVLAGGWGSPLLEDVANLRQQGQAVDQTWALGRDHAGQPVARLAALVVDLEAVRAGIPDQ